jgi:hypothetical protein
MSNSKLHNLTLSELKDLECLIPQLGGFASRILVETYKEFIDVLYTDIDNIIYRIQDNAELRQNDSEDRLTIDIVNQLNCLGYDASHETKIGGHVDILVKKNQFKWIGEAKIHGAYDYLWKGFLQLSTRYSVADSNQKDGGIIIYIRQKDANLIINKWKSHLVSKNLPDYSCDTCKNREMSFFSIHKHESSGLPFRIRHLPVILYFNPQDKF